MRQTILLYLFTFYFTTYEVQVKTSLATLFYRLTRLEAPRVGGWKVWTRRETVISALSGKLITVLCSAVRCRGPRALTGSSPQKRVRACVYEKELAVKHGYTYIHTFECVCVYALYSNFHWLLIAWKSKGKAQYSHSATSWLHGGLMRACLLACL